MSVLKILGGQAKGRSLKTLPGTDVRPMLGRIKKSVFDILQPRINGSLFLDIYAGSGSVGLEALSRGAKQAVFIENDARCVTIVHENIKFLKVENQSLVYRVSAIGEWPTLPGPFDIVFMGPPYKDHEKTALFLVDPTLQNVIKHDVVSKKGLIIAQHHKKEKVNSQPPWVIVREEAYGDTTVTFYRYEPAS